MRNNRIIKLLAIAVIAVCFVNCQKKGKNNSFTTYNNLESISGWDRVHPTIVKGDAFSGNSYIQLNKENVYGAGFKMKIEDLGFKTFNTLSLSTAVRIKNSGEEACVVVNVYRGDSSIYWEALNTRSFNIEPNIWTPISKQFVFPSSKFQSDDVLMIFPWSNKGYSVDFDDIKLSIKF
jgi:hypothetical protein